MNINKMFDRIRRDKDGNFTSVRPFSLFLIRALNATADMPVEERAKWIAKAWKHKSKYYTSGEDE